MSNGPLTGRWEVRSGAEVGEAGKEASLKMLDKAGHGVQTEIAKEEQLPPQEET